MQRQPSSIETKIFAGFGVALILSVLISLATYLNHARLVETRRKVVETQEVLRSLKEILLTITDAETGTRGFILTGDEEFLDPFNKAAARLAPDVERVSTAARNDRSIQARLGKLAELTRERLQALARTNALRRSSGFDVTRDLPALREGRMQMDEIFAK
jgi:CHASE3 domain sensor protein